MLYCASTMIILRNEDPRNARSFRLFLYLSTSLLLLITVYVVVQIIFGEEMWITHANYPGGSAAYLSDNAAVWYQTFGSAASIVLNLMSDGLLVSTRLHICVWKCMRLIGLYSFTAAMSLGKTGESSPRLASSIWARQVSTFDLIRRTGVA